MKQIPAVHSLLSINTAKILIVPLLIIISGAKLSATHDLEITGNITELGTDYLIVQGYKIFVDGNTEFRGPSNTTVTFSYFRLNDLVQVQADSKGDGTYLATRVKFEDTGVNEDEIELTGYVTYIGIDSLIINGITFVTDSSTEFRGRHGNPFSFDQIKINMLLEVRAKTQTPGTLLASRVRTEDDHPRNEDIEITGIIDSITSNSIIIGELEFFTNLQTVFLSSSNAPITFGGLHKGDKVEVNASMQPDSTLLASVIRLEDLPENEIEFTAQVENIAGSNLTVGGIIFSTDSNTVFLDNNRMPVTITDLSIGMWVEIKGSKISESSYYASSVKIEDFVRTEIEIKGTIAAISDSDLVVNGITFSVDSTTAVLDNLNNPLEYSALQVGRLVEVNGEKTGETTAKANTIELKDSADVEIFGKITAVNSDNIELNGLTVFVNEKTIYLNQANQPAAFTDLSIDLFVEVKMLKNPDSTLTALRIKIEDGTYYSKISGTAGTVDGSSIQLASGIYSITAATTVIDNNFNVINASQLAAGQPVIVWALTDALSSNTALQIQSKSVTPTGVSENPAVVNNFMLRQNYPNPFNPSTIISFTINAEQNITLKVFNSIGEEVRTLINGNLSAGEHKITFNALGLSSGIYFYRLESGSNVQVKKMIFMK